MRCDNCGWDNTDTAAECIKCKTPLHSSIGNKSSSSSPASPGAPFDGTIPDSAAKPAGTPARFAGTIPDTSPASAIPHRGELIKCTSCGYENSSEAKFCQLCKKPFQAAAEGVAPTASLAPTVPSGPAAPAATVADAAAIAPRKMSAATIDPYRMRAAPAPVCYLMPVPREKEKPEKDGEARAFIYLDEPITLNRENLEEKNNSITSKVQAELSCENGKWYLSDRSDLQTTFIRVGEKTELREGDILLMGDRKFVFTIKDDQHP